VQPLPLDQKVHRWISPADHGAVNNAAHRQPSRPWPHTAEIRAIRGSRL